MSSSTQNELQSGQNNKTSETIQPPADKITRTIVERAASFVSKNGLEFESKIEPNDARYNFLRSPEDPHHAYYKHKLAEYCAWNQNRDPDDDSVDYDANIQPEDHLRSLEIFDTPPHVRISTLIDRTSLLVTKNGTEFERMVMTRTADDPRFNFLKNRGPYHEFYMSRCLHYSFKYRGRGAQRINVELGQRIDVELAQPKPQFVLPEGMTLMELDTIKITAKLVAWYGEDVFLGELSRRAMTKRHFQFIKPTDSWFPFFTQVVTAYSKVWKPPKDLNEDLRKNPDEMDIILDDLFMRTRLHELKLKHDSVAEKYFANKELPPTVEQKFDESALVPGQFLAQHPGSSTIMHFCSQKTWQA